MDDVAVRAVLVGLVAAVVVVAVVVMRKSGDRRVHERRRVDGLEPGIYFFSSAACGECDPARDQLVSRIGEGDFVEFRWEENADLFSRQGIDGVPATMVVRADRSATIRYGPLDDSFPL